MMVMPPSRQSDRQGLHGDRHRDHRHLDVGGQGEEQGPEHCCAHVPDEWPAVQVDGKGSGPDVRNGTGHWDLLRCGILRVSRRYFGSPGRYRRRWPGAARPDQDRAAYRHGCASSHLVSPQVRPKRPGTASRLRSTAIERGDRPEANPQKAHDLGYARTVRCGRDAGSLPRPCDPARQPLSRVAQAIRVFPAGRGSSRAPPDESSAAADLQRLAALRGRHTCWQRQACRRGTPPAGWPACFAGYHK
jgi:hypothetical protein